MSYYKRDKLSIKSNELLSNILAQLILLTEDVQTYRQLLANTPYFDCIELFRVLDRDQKGYLCLKDFQYIIGSSHKKLVAYAFSYFDQTKLGQVSRLQFSSFLLSRRNMQLRQLVSQRIESPELQLSPDYVVGDQLKLFTNLIQAIINQQMKIICFRKELLKSHDYSIKGVLSSLDVNDHKWVSLSDIHKFMQNYGISTPIDQVQNIVQLMDSQLNGKITIDQLKWIVQGFQGKDKEYLKRLKGANRLQEGIRASRNTNSNKNVASQSKKIDGSQSQRKANQKINQVNVFVQKEQNEKNYLSQKKIGQSKGKNSKKDKQNAPQPSQFYSILRKFKQIQEYSNQIDQRLLTEQMKSRAQNQQQYDKKVREKNIKQNQKYIQQLRAKKNIQNIRQKYNYQNPNRYEDLLYLTKYTTPNYNNQISYVEKQKDYKYKIAGNTNVADKKYIDDKSDLVHNDPVSSNSFLSAKQKNEIDRKVDSYKNSSVNSSKLDKKDSIYSFSNSRKELGASSRYERLYQNEDYKYAKDYVPLSKKLEDSYNYQRKLTFFDDPYINRYNPKANSILDYNLQTKKSHFFDDKQQVRRSPDYTQVTKLESTKKSEIPVFQSPSRRVNQMMTGEKWKYGNTTQTRPGVSSQQKQIY